MSEARLAILAAAGLLILPLVAALGSPSTVPGWVVSGSAAEKYFTLVDTSVVHEGAASAGLVSQAPANAADFGTLMQIVDARPHIGERMRLSAFIRASGVKIGAALWMRVDSVDGEVLSFDNMSRRGLIRGDQSWQQVEIILDVPPKSKAISFGVLLKGEGMIWIDDVSLEPVAGQNATTGFKVQMRLPVAPDDLAQTPSNLDFED